MSDPKKGDKYIYIGGKTHPQWLGEVFTIDRVEGEDIYFVERQAHTFRRDLDNSFLPESAVQAGKSYICCKKGHTKYGQTVRIGRCDGMNLTFEKLDGETAGIIRIDGFHKYFLPKEFSIDIQPYSKEEVDQLLEVVKSVGFEYCELGCEPNFLVFCHDKSFGKYKDSRDKQLVCISRLIDINPWIKNIGVDSKLGKCEVKFATGTTAVASKSSLWGWSCGDALGNIKYYREIPQESKPKVGDTVYSDETCVENKNPCQEISLGSKQFNSINTWKSPELVEVSMVSAPPDVDSTFLVPEKSLLSRIWNNKLVKDWIG